MRVKLKHIFLLLLVSAFTSCINEKKGTIQLVTPDEMIALQKDKSLQVVDVRTPEEFALESIPNSQNIDFNSPNFDQDISKLDKNKPVLVYCRSNRRSSQCAKKLEDAGFTKVYELKGGISRWKYEGLDVESKS